MRADTIKTYKAVHTWTGVTAGLALFIAFYAGALTVFVEPIARWVSPPSIGADAVDLHASPRLIEQVLAAHPQAREEMQLELRSAENVPARLTWHQHPLGADGQPDPTREEHWWATLRADGTLHAQPHAPSELATLEGFIDMLHQTAGIPGASRIGTTFMGIVSLVYALALLSGLIVLLPSLLKDLFLLRVGRNLKRMWLDAHNVIGVSSLPFHMVIALSAAYYGLGGWLGLAQAPLTGPDAYRAELRQQLTPPPPSGRAAAMLAPQEILRIAQSAAPSMSPHYLYYQNAGDATARVMVVGASERYMSKYAGTGIGLNAVTGETVSTLFLAEGLRGWSALANGLDALHFGSFGGWGVRWAYFLLGLAGAWLFYSGNLLWLETRRRTQRGQDPCPEQRRDVRFMAAATVGVCLGCVAGLSLSIAAGKWLHGHVDDLNSWHQRLYYAVFLSALAWAFWRGAARAAVSWLWLSALFTLAIPLSTLAAWLWPSLNLWAHTSVAALGVDATALAGALGLAALARATARRVAQGPADSVWSAPRRL